MRESKHGTRTRPSDVPRPLGARAPARFARAVEYPRGTLTLDRVSSGAPDLFVVCKNCGSEVSPYITECPYCGVRLRKRAPKIDRDGRIAERTRRRPQAPSLPRLRRGEIPGIRAEARPYATAALVLLGIVGCLVWRTTAVSLPNLVVIGLPEHHWWRVVTAPFVYDNTGYAFIALTCVAIFGSLLERRHGPLVVAVLALIAGAGSAAVSARVGVHPMLGGNGMALALLLAWAVPDLLDVAGGHQIEGDLMGAGVLGVVVALVPIAAPNANWVAAGVGAAVGLILGFALARRRE